MAEKLIREILDGNDERMYYDGSNIISQKTGNSFEDCDAFISRFLISKDGNLIFNDKVLDGKTGIAITGSFSDSPVYDSKIVLLVSKFEGREVTNGVAMLCQHAVSVLSKPLALDDGTELPAGTTVIIMPETAAECVRVPGGKSLSETWNDISKSDHTHPDYENLIAGMQTLIARYSERLTSLEAWATEKGYSLPSTENQQDNT